MESPKTNTTLQFPQKQPQNGRYGRLPLDLLPKILSLSNQEAKVFMVLSMLANFKREPLGMVECESLSDLARKIGIPRRSFYRTLSALQRTGLVTRPGPDTCVIVTHYVCHEDTPLCHEDTPPVSSCLTESPQPQPSIGSCEPPIRSEEVSEEEVKKGARKARKARAAKAAPPHPLNGLVSWDKEGRRVRFHDRSREFIRGRLLDIAKEEGLKHLLDDGEMHEGLSRLNGHLMGNPFKTNPKTLPAIVLNWFETDLRRKNNNPQRGKPLAQRIDEKTRERMNDGIEESGQSDNGFTQQLLESGDFRRHS